MEEKIYITSDIHSDIEALKFIINLASQDNASLLLIAGDLVPSSLEFTQVLQSAPLRYVCVRGNCDSLWDFKDLNLAIPPMYSLNKYQNRNIFIYHSHILYESPIELNEGDIAITGHSHTPHLYKENGIYFVNPGSLSRPRSEEGATYGVIKDNSIKIKKVNGKTIKEIVLSWYFRNSQIIAT